MIKNQKKHGSTNIIILLEEYIVENEFEKINKF